MCRTPTEKIEIVRLGKICVCIEKEGRRKFRQVRESLYGKFSVNRVRNMKRNKCYLLNKTEKGKKLRLPVDYAPCT